jgi:hypothetical protein
MAQLESRDGVRCDQCHLVLKEKFEYFSYDLCETQIHGQMAPSELRANRNNKVHSLDLCKNCHDFFSKRVVDTNALLQAKKRRGRADCELTGAPIPDGPALIVFVTAVGVDLESQNVTSDTNHLSFLIGSRLKSEFDIKPVSPEAAAWETTS